jgi:acetyl-CoA C-acetyltransferase
MSKEVAIIGVGYAGFRPLTPEVSYKELMFEAATKAYEEAGINPRKDVQSFVTVSEDFNEGTSIFDEYVPDQLGGVLKPVHTVCGDGIHGLAAAFLQIKTGQFDIVVVESHSKASNILYHSHLLAFALDPIFNRPLAFHPYAIAGMEMRRYLAETGTTHKQCAMVVAKNRQNALLNPLASYPAKLTPEDVLASEPIAEPLTSLEISRHADGAIVMVLASGEVARALSDKPIWIRGIGWANDTFWLESRPWARADYATKAAKMAYEMAGIRNPRHEIDFAEIDDTFAYKELQHMEALGLCAPGEAGILTEEGYTSLEGEFPVNPSGGNLGMGHMLDASGLARVMEVVFQLRGEAGKRQIPDAQVGLAFGWRGIPTTSGAAVILSI